MKKLLSIFGLIVFILIGTTNLYACGGEGGGEGGVDGDFLAAMFGNKKALAGLGFKPFSQESNIPKAILDIPIHTYKEEQMIKKEKKYMKHWENEAKEQIDRGNLMDAKSTIGNIVKFGAGLGVAILAPEGAMAIAIGAAYSGATTAAEDASSHKSGGEIMTDSTAAAVKSGVIGKYIPDAIAGSLVDEATNHLSFGPKRTPVRAGCGGACTISQGNW